MEPRIYPKKNYTKIFAIVLGLCAAFAGGVYIEPIYNYLSNIHAPEERVIENPGTLYISGVPDNNLNQFPNIFSLSVPSGEHNQLTGVGASTAYGLNYINHTNSGNKFMLLPTAPVNDFLNKVEPFIITSGTPANSSFNESIPNMQAVQNLQVSAGVLTSGLTVTPNGARGAFISHFSDSDILTEEDLPNLHDFSTWTIGAVSAGAEDNTNHYFENATDPIFFSNDNLLFLRADAVYVYDFLVGDIRPLVTAESLNFPSFSTKDSIMVTGHAPDSQLLIYKHDTSELITLEYDTQSNPSSDFRIINRTILAGHEGRVIYQFLRVTDTTFATLHVNVDDTDTPDFVVIYDIHSGTPTALHTYSMAGITIPGTTMLDSWSSGQYKSF